MAALELFWSMMKEEWRIHSSIFGNLRFALFPFLVISIGLLGTLAVSNFQLLFTRQSIVLATHYLFFFFGLNVGAFGLHAREFMNRRFGQASLIAYSSRTLPVAERTIFVGMVKKDIVYYFALWILPLIIGFSLAAPLLHVPVSYGWVFLLTLSLSFLLGLSAVFFLSMLYARLGKIMVMIIMLAASAAGLMVDGILYKFPPFVYFLTRDLSQVLVSLILIAALMLLSIAFVTFDFPSRRDRFADSLTGSIRRLSFAGELAKFVAKDLLDLQRSEGGFGKILFNMLLPMCFVWVFLSYLTQYVPQLGFLVLFSIFMGVFASTAYTWLTEYDLFNQYLFLPVNVSTIMKSKMLGYAMINMIPVLILATVGIIRHEIALIPLAVLLFAITSFFTLSITVLFTGLSPSVLFMNVSVIVKYLLILIPTMLCLIFLYVFGPIYLALGSGMLLVASLLIIRQAFRRWDTRAQQVF
jgi:hypothetical protein